MSNASDFIIENGVLKEYVGPGGDVIIPEGVTEIGETAFCKVEKINGYTVVDPICAVSLVCLPVGLKKIGKKAFFGHKALARIHFPDTLKTIESGAFWRCGLEEVTIPQSVTKIEADAFRFCAMKRVSICGKTKIGKNAFAESGKWGEFLAGEPGIEFEVPDDMPTLPLFLDWDELYPTVRGRFIHDVLRKEFALRPADVRYVVSRLMANKQTLLPEIMASLTLVELKTLEETDSITAANADLLLELLSDNVECRAELIDYIGRNVTEAQREMVQEKEVDRAVKMVLKRAKTLDDALVAFYKAKQGDIKKLWKCVEAEEGLLIEKYNGTEITIVIPAEVDGKAVVGLSVDAMRAAAVDEKKNAYNKKMYKNKAVIVMDGIRLIGETAFAGCVYMTDVCLPASVTKIGQDAFLDCHKLTIHAPAGSYAEQYAKENNIPFVAE